MQGTSSSTVTYASINEAPLGGSTFDFDVLAPDISTWAEPVVFTISTYLTNYPSITETYTVTVDFECPSHNFELQNQATLPLAFTHEFNQAVAPLSYNVSRYIMITQDPSCEHNVPFVEDSANNSAPYITYSLIADNISIDVFDRSLVDLVG